MANIKNFKLLRNQIPAASKAAVISLLEALTNQDEGTLIIGRYTEDNVPGSVLGIVNLDGSVDVINPAGEVAEAIAALDSTLTLSGTSATDAHFTQVAIVDGMLNPTTSAGSNIDLAHLVDLVVSNDANALLATTDTIHGALTKLEAAILGMDKAASAVNGQVVTTVSEADGVVSETKANVKDLQLGGYSKDTSATGAIGSTDTVNTALSKLENAIGKNAVSSTDNTIEIDTTGSTTDLSVNIDGTTLVANSSTGVISSNLQLTQLTSAEVTALSDANVKEAYKLIYATDSNRTAIGNVVKIYKDSALQEVYLGSGDDTVNSSTGVVTKYAYELISDPTTKITAAAYEELTAEQKALYQAIDSQSMNFVHQLADGSYSITKIDVSKFLSESEFGDGLAVSPAGVVSVNIDNNSEKVRIADDVHYTQAECDIANSELEGYIAAESILTAEEATAVNTALGLSGDDAYEAGDELSTEDANAYNATLDGAITTNDVKTSGEVEVLTVSSNGVEVNHIQDAIDYAVESLDDEVVKEGSINGVDGTVTNNKLELTVTGADIELTDYEPLVITANAAQTVEIEETDTVNDAIAKLEKAVNVNETVVAAALNDLDSTKVDVISVNGVTNKTASASDVVASVTLDGDDIELTGYTKPASTSAIAATDTVNEAIGKLEKGLETAVAGGLQQVNSGNAAIDVSAVSSNQQDISLVVAASNGTAVNGSTLVNPLSIDSTNGLVFAETLDAGYYAVPVNP